MEADKHGKGKKICKGFRIPDPKFVFDSFQTVLEMLGNVKESNAEVSRACMKNNKKSPENAMAVAYAEQRATFYFRFGSSVQVPRDSDLYTNGKCFDGQTRNFIRANALHTLQMFIAHCVVLI